MHPVLKTVLGRLAMGLVTLFVVSIIIFSSMELLPGDFGQAVLGQAATEETVAAFRRELGLDQPAIVRYGQWIAAALQGDLGTSFSGRNASGVDRSREVIDLVAPRLQKARRRFVGSADQPVLDAFGDNLDTLCLLWTAKEAAFKVFGSGLDFLTGLQWSDIHGHSARAEATVQGVTLDISWQQLESPNAWLAVAMNNEQT